MLTPIIRTVYIITNARSNYSLSKEERFKKALELRGVVFEYCFSCYCYKIARAPENFPPPEVWQTLDMYYEITKTLK